MWHTAVLRIWDHNNMVIIFVWPLQYTRSTAQPSCGQWKQRRPEAARVEGLRSYAEAPCDLKSLLRGNPVDRSVKEILHDPQPATYSRLITWLSKCSVGFWCMLRSCRVDISSAVPSASQAPCSPASTSHCPKPLTQRPQPPPAKSPEPWIEICWTSKVRRTSAS